MLAELLTRTTEVQVKNLLQVHLANHKFHVGRPGTEPGLRD